MVDHNISRNKSENIETEYFMKFNCDLPGIEMGESMEDYYNELRAAIKRGKPITEDDERRPTRDRNGDLIKY